MTKLDRQEGQRLRQWRDRPERARDRRDGIQEIQIGSLRRNRVPPRFGCSNHRSEPWPSDPASVISGYAHSDFAGSKWAGVLKVCRASGERLSCECK